MISSLSRLSTARVSSVVSLASVAIQPITQTVTSVVAKTSIINSVIAAKPIAITPIVQNLMPIAKIAKIEPLVVQKILPAYVPIKEVALKQLPIVAKIVPEMKLIPQTPIKSLVTEVARQSIILPLIVPKVVIVPTRVLNLSAGKQYDPRLTQGFVSTTAKFKPYEALTGISQERPEIVMMTNFQPLFNRDVSHNAPYFINAFDDIGQTQFMTDAGRYIDAQYHMRSIQSWNVQQHIKTLKQRYPFVESMLSTTNDEFSRGIIKLKDNANFLLNLVRVLESQKLQLDLRHDLYRVDPSQAVNKYVQGSSQAVASLGTAQAPHVLSTLVQTQQKQHYDPSDALIDIGFNADQVKNVFSSTKIWAQLLIELKAVLKHHSLKFLDIPVTYYSNDRSATTINQPKVGRFDIADNLPTLPGLSELVKLQIGNVAKSITLLQPVYASIYQNVFFKNEEARLGALANLLSREYRYSAGLGDEKLSFVLRNFYGFSPNASANQSMFDTVLGRFGNSITDLPALGDSSLASIAQRQVGQVGVLTFESKYVEGDTGTLTPGGEFYFDRILEDTAGDKFDTTGIDQLATTLQSHADNFSTFVDGLNLLAVPVNTNLRAAGYYKVNDQHFLTNALEVIHQVGDKLVNPRNGVAQTAAVNDRLGAIYSQARKDNRIKTILFLYTLMRISRSYTTNVPYFVSDPNADNTATADALVKELVRALETTVPESRTTIQLVTQRGLDKGLNTASLTGTSIASALKSGTQITRIIEDFMSAVITQFRNRSTALNGGFTRYSGYLDTIVMMMAFDFAIAMVARYSNQQLVGVHRGLNAFSQGQTTFAVSQTATNHLTSYNELIQRITAEQNRMRQMVLTVMNTLNNLGGSMKGVSNYLNGKEAVMKLRDVSAAVGNDPTVLRMLLNEQQIMLLASTCDSLVTAYNSYQYLDNKNGYLNNAQGGAARANQELAVLDESEIPPAMREALYGYFGTGDFASVRGTNKRIMTIGVPLGFAERLKQKVNTKNLKKQSFQNKQSDIVYVCIYKVDIQHSDIVYKPIRYMFELSRFPTRFTTSHWLPLKHKPTVTDIVNAIPTQCYDSSPGSGTANSISAGIEYASTAIANNAGVKGARAAFVDETYSFLTAKQRAEILHNHVVSQLLEVYVKLMTGINVAEHTFYLEEMPKHVTDELMKTLTEHSVAHAAGQVKAQKATAPMKTIPSPGILFTTTAKSIMQPYSVASGVARRVLPGGGTYIYSIPQPKQTNQVPKSLEQQKQGTSDLGKNLDELNRQAIPAVVAQMKTMVNFSNILSSLSSQDALNYKVLSPKDFDRVFNVIVDPRDFQIDVPKTTETPHGRQALDLLLKSGDVVPVNPLYWGGSQWLNEKMQVLAATNVLEGRSFPQGRLPRSIDNFTFRDRDKNQGDLITDKYFITIETFDEEEV